MGDVAAARPRWVGPFAVGAAAVSVVLAALGAWVHVTARADGLPTDRLSASDLIVATLFPAVGALVLWREPRNVCGWVLLSCSLLGVSALAHQWAVHAEVAHGGDKPLGELAVWLAAWTYWPYWLQPTVLPVLFPNGRAPSPRWRRFVVVVLVLVGIGVLSAMFKPDPDVEGMGLANPLGVGPRSLIWVWIVGQAGPVQLLGFVAAPVALAGLARRQRRATGAERAQLQWLLLGFAACVVLGLSSVAMRGGAAEALFSVAFASIPVCVGVAIVRHGMLDVELVAGRTIGYALLTGGGVLVYVGLVAAAGRYVGGDGVGPVVAAVVVAAAAAARSRLQQAVDRRLFGARRDPYAVVQQVGVSTSVADDPGEALRALVGAVRDALRLPFVQVLDADGAVAAESGAAVAGTHVLPVVERGRRLGVLVVGRRTRNERLHPEERSALQDVARRAGALLHAAELSDDLQRSYERTVLAREEERRRLRRDLHDGVGPVLAGMALQMDSLATRLGDDDALAQRAERLRDQLRTTVGEVRRIVDGLRPAAVDELGLAEALRQLETSDGEAVRVSVDVDLPSELPAAVEVAAYRIAGEAVANAIRHSGAARATLTAHVRDGELRLEVADDGRGFGADVTAGVGLQSLHDRAAEVGGRLDVISRPERGTVVEAVLPLGSR